MIGANTRLAYTFKRVAVGRCMCAGMHGREHATTVLLSMNVLLMWIATVTLIKALLFVIPYKGSW